METRKQMAPEAQLDSALPENRHRTQFSAGLSSPSHRELPVLDPIWGSAGFPGPRLGSSQELSLARPLTLTHVEIVITCKYIYLSVAIVGGDRCCELIRSLRKERVRIGGTGSFYGIALCCGITSCRKH